MDAIQLEDNDSGDVAEPKDTTQELGEAVDVEKCGSSASTRPSGNIECKSRACVFILCRTTWWVLETERRRITIATHGERRL